MVEVSFPSKNATVTVPRGTILLEALSKLQTTFYAPCAGRGLCGKCKVMVGGGVAPPSDVERQYLSIRELESGVRLACQAALTGDAVVSAAETAACNTILSGGPARDTRGEPTVWTRVAEVDVDSLEGRASYWERVAAAFGLGGDVEPHLTLARKLSGVLGEDRNLESGRFTVQAVFVNDSIVDVLRGRTDVYGVALDIGTTTVVAYLVDLQAGKVVGVAGDMNPQANHGADVVSRISYAESKNGLETLRRGVVDAVNQLIAKLAIESGIGAHQIYAVVAVGNACMQHLFLGISPGPLAIYPYIPVLRRRVELSPVEASININENGRIMFLPGIAGFVGSDTLAVAVACNLRERSGARLAIDVGTNGEILLASEGRILACSTAAGPAFEGAGISCGMVAGRGAIDHVWLVNGGGGAPDIAFHVIGGGRPKGICGSGLISLVAVLRQAGILDPSGRFTQGHADTGAPLSRRLVEGQTGVQFVLSGDPGLEDSTTPAVVVTQRDVRELQLAKGAIRAGAAVLLRELGVRADDLQSIILAGAFGSYLDGRAATAIGLLPLSRRAELVPVGNAAGEGAVLTLTSRNAYLEALSLADKIEHVNLGSHEEFQDIFAEAMFLEPM